MLSFLEKKNFCHQDCVFTEGKVTRNGPNTTEIFATQQNPELSYNAVTKHSEGHQGSIEPNILRYIMIGKCNIGFFVLALKTKILASKHRRKVN